MIFFLSLLEKYTHMYIHDHNLVVSFVVDLDALTMYAPLFFQLTSAAGGQGLENVSCLGWCIVHQHVSVLTDLYHVVVSSIADDVYRVC